MYVPIAFNLQFAQVHPPKITIPAKQRELRQKQQVRLERVTSFLPRFIALEYDQTLCFCQTFCFCQSDGSGKESFRMHT